MNIYLCLLGQSLISIKIFNYLNSDRLSNKNIIFIMFYLYLLIILFVLFFCDIFWWKKFYW